MKRLSIIIMALMALPFAATAQKPALDHSVYDGWKTIVRPVDQMDGEWVIYGVSPQEGDGVLYFYNSAKGTEYAVERGTAGRISQDGKKAVFKIQPKFQETRKAKIDKKKPDQMPKDTLAVIDLASGKLTKYPQLKSLKVPTELLDHVAFTAKEKDSLYVLDIKTLAIDTLRCVENCYLSADGKSMAYVTKPGKKDSTVKRGIYMYDFKTGRTDEVLTGEKKATFGSAYFNDDNSKMAFYANLDTAKDASKLTDIYLYEKGAVRKLVARDAQGLPAGWKISSKANINFGPEDAFITIGTCPIPREKDTTLVDFEQPRLDIWVWNEDYIQPIQKSRLARTKAQTYVARVNLDGNGQLIQLAGKDIPSVSVPGTKKQDKVLAYTDKPYRVQQQWDGVTRRDIYLVDLTDGSRKLLMQNVPYSYFSTSPDGEYTAFYDYSKSNWFLYTLATGEVRDLTSNLGVIFYDDEDDHPSVPPVCGSCQWFDDSKTFVLQDQYDIWQFDASGKQAPMRLTQGRENRVRYGIANPYASSRESRLKGTNLLKDRALYFTTFDRTTKENGFAVLDITRKKAKLQQLVSGPYTYGTLCVNNSGKKPVYTYTKGNYEVGNNVWCTSDNFASEKQLSDANPQQKDYNWGTVELVSWTTEDGIKAEGLLYKPEDFDANKKYPVIIYFYEKYSDELYGVRNPAPSASTVNIPYFVSNGYICFIPDIYYTDGHPGKSALKSILPACDMLCEYPWIDGDNMAIQGQSWGGYQTAYMITQTNRFKAAGAGAPVSNMTSAYGGIRWESGLARTGQYEHGQSRIGKDLWDGFDLYVENSPLFFVPNVTTPVLIMHNDADGAVPSWQGIEFFNGLRRCGKQAWLLQYNDEAHNLKERRNRKDLSIRLAQFFDHFLKGAPAPIWMTEGVPAELKGIEYGYGYKTDED